MIASSSMASASSNIKKKKNLNNENRPSYTLRSIENIQEHIINDKSNIKHFWDGVKYSSSIYKFDFPGEKFKLPQPQLDNSKVNKDMIIKQNKENLNRKIP